MNASRPLFARRGTLWRLAGVTSLCVGTLLASAATPRGAGTIRALEQALETRSSAVALPSAGVGTVVVTPCGNCKPISMIAGSASLWMLGERAVSFDELRRALQSHPRAPVLVFYRGPGDALTRLIARVPGMPAR